MKTRKRLLAVMLLTLVLAIPGAAGENAKTLFNVDPLPGITKLRVAYFVGSIHGLPNFVGVEKGWFKDVGLDVELVPFINGPAIMEAKRSWDVGTTGAPGLISGIVGQDVTMIGLAAWDNILDLFVREDHPIFKAGKGHIPGYPEIYGRPEDWRGSQWLLPAGTTMHYVILTTLGHIGLTERDVRINNMDVTSAFTAFKAGQGDGLGVWTTLAVMAKESDYKKVSGIEECGSYMGTTIFANEQALATLSEAVKKYLEIYLAVSNWIDMNRDQATDLYVEACEEEGVVTTHGVAKATIESTHTPTLKQQIDFSENLVDDPN
ncbi:MAG: ABC transporter substrate-binding protein, partial [Planctomycetes bacterium]|nr:ABC transporter substrate-binding protein [Planctomycetota bacterium]